MAQSRADKVKGGQESMSCAVLVDLEPKVGDGVRTGAYR